MSSIDVFMNKPRPAGGQPPMASAMKRAQSSMGSQRLQGVAAPLQPIVDTLQQMDPQSREFARLMYNQAFQDAGVPFQIPDMEELELKQLRRQKESLTLRKEIATETINQVDAVLKAMPPEWKAKQGIYTDNLLDEQPGKFLQVARDMGYEIDAQTLALGGFEESDTDAAAKTAEKQSKMEAEQLSREVSMAENAEKLAEQGDIYEPMISKILGETEEQMGVDLFTFDTDVDEVAGARALMAGYDKLMKNTPVAQRRRAAESFIKMKGDDIRDAMEEAQVDEKGSMIFGTGTADADPDAIWFLGALSLRMARDMGMKSGSDLFSKLGIPATQMDQASFVSYGQQIASGLGEDFMTQTMPALMGLGGE